jgi:hypothetical protein
MNRSRPWLAVLALGAIVGGACATTGGASRSAPAGAGASSDGSAAGTGRTQEGTLSAAAPADRPVGIRAESLAGFQEAIAPYVAQARATYPEAKRRYLAGLPPGETFFVTTMLVDPDGHFEQVFILVDKIEAGFVTGRIFSDVATVRGFHPRDVYRFAEGQIVDWLISKPDGSEEGNLVGKYIDSLPRRI